MEREKKSNRKLSELKSIFLGVQNSSKLLSFCGHSLLPLKREVWSRMCLMLLLWTPSSILKLLPSPLKSKMMCSRKILLPLLCLVSPSFLMLLCSLEKLIARRKPIVLLSLLRLTKKSLSIVLKFPWITKPWILNSINNRTFKWQPSPPTEASLNINPWTPCTNSNNPTNNNPTNNNLAFNNHTNKYTNLFNPCLSDMSQSKIKLFNPSMFNLLLLLLNQCIDLSS